MPPEHEQPDFLRKWVSRWRRTDDKDKPAQGGGLHPEKLHPASREFLVEDVLRDEQLPPEPALPRGEIPASDAKIVLAAVDAGQAILKNIDRFERPIKHLIHEIPSNLDSFSAEQIREAGASSKKACNAFFHVAQVLAEISEWRAAQNVCQLSAVSCDECDKLDAASVSLREQMASMVSMCEKVRLVDKMMSSAVIVDESGERPAQPHTTPSAAAEGAAPSSTTKEGCVVS